MTWGSELTTLGTLQWGRIPSGTFFPNKPITLFSRVPSFIRLRGFSVIPTKVSFVFQFDSDPNTDFHELDVCLMIIPWTRYWLQYNYELYQSKMEFRQALQFQGKQGNSLVWRKQMVSRSLDHPSPLLSSLFLVPLWLTERRALQYE